MKEFDLIIHYDRIGESDMYNCHEVGKLVRCKDCKLRDVFGKCVAYEAFWSLGDDGFCSLGERKDESTMGQVKHGHWVKYGSPLFSEWECSECGERHTGNDLPNKCPHCKAKMDEVEE